MLDKIIHGDCLKVSLPSNYFDTLITDPPYGLSFMGKDWDKGVPGKAFWKKFLDACKPGAFAFVFGGTRTHHRLTCAIEDAGWEIRDCMMWLYGSGFPKSLDISKAIDKTKGVRRERVEGGIGKKSGETYSKNGGYIAGEAISNEPITNLAKLWDGYGTALKPAVEIILCAEKPLVIKDFTSILAHRLKDTICQLKSYAKTVEGSSLLNHQGQNVVCPDSALWVAVEKSNTPVDLLGLMDTWPSELEIPLSLSIGLLWLNTLAEIYLQTNTFTTETVISLTTDLKILNSLQSKITPDCLIQAATGQLGIGSNVEIVASIFSAAKAKLSNIPAVFVQDNAISRVHISCRGGLVPNWEPIIVAMKPLDGTFAHNAEKWGVAGLNIDGSRIKSGKQPGKRSSGGFNSGGNSNCYGDSIGVTNSDYSNGRWPANLILDEEAGAMLDEQSGNTKSSNRPRNNKVPTGEKGIYGHYEPVVTHGHKDSGGASRFFYCAKASKKERNAGCEGVTTWENADLKDNLNGVVSLVKDISEDTMCLPSDSECCMILFGRITSDQSQQDLMFIIKMMTKQIIRLKTLSCDPNLPIRDYILGVIKTLQDNGLNPAVSAENISQLIPSITNEKMASALGVVVAVLQTLSKISERGKQGNIHSTVKPLALMEYLCKLSRTPTGGIVLDPFGGSGTTALACKNTSRRYVIIEKKLEYCKIASARLGGGEIASETPVVKEQTKTQSTEEQRQKIIAEAYARMKNIK